MITLAAAEYVFATQISTLITEPVAAALKSKYQAEFDALRQAVETLIQTQESLIANLELYTYRVCAITAALVQTKDDEIFSIYAASCVSSGNLITAVDVIPKSVNALNFHNPIGFQLH